MGLVSETKLKMTVLLASPPVLGLHFDIFFWLFFSLCVLWNKGVREEVAATEVLFKCELKQGDMKLQRENQGTLRSKICESVSVSFC